MAVPITPKTATISWTPANLVGDPSSLLTSTVNLYTTTLFKITIEAAGCITTDSIKVIVNQGQILYQKTLLLFILCVLALIPSLGLALLQPMEYPIPGRLILLDISII